MKSAPDEKPRVGRPPLGKPEQKTRNVRMDDVRWQYFTENLGASWLRFKIDEAIDAKTKVKHSDQ